MNISKIYDGVPIIILQEFIKIKIEKENAVKNQQYENAANLRDKEKNMENMYDLSDFTSHLKENNYSLNSALRDIKIQEFLN